MSLITTKAVTLYTCTDGKQFEQIELAEAHQFGIENAEKISLAVESYLNSRLLKNRSRQQKATIAADMYAFMLTWDGKAIERTEMDDEIVEKAVEVADVATAEVEVEGATTVEATAETEAKAEPTVEAKEDDLF
jgi:hypothetical protein